MCGDRPGYQPGYTASKWTLPSASVGRCPRRKSSSATSIPLLQIGLGGLVGVGALDVRVPDVDHRALDRLARAFPEHADDSRIGRPGTPEVMSMRSGDCGPARSARLGRGGCAAGVGILLERIGVVAGHRGGAAGEPAVVVAAHLLLTRRAAAVGVLVAGAARRVTIGAGPFVGRAFTAAAARGVERPVGAIGVPVATGRPHGVAGRRSPTALIVGAVVFAACRSHEGGAADDDGATVEVVVRHGGRVRGTAADWPRNNDSGDFARGPYARPPGRREPPGDPRERTRYRGNPEMEFGL